MCNTQHRISAELTCCQVIGSLDSFQTGFESHTSFAFATWGKENVTAEFKISKWSWTLNVCMQSYMTQFMRLDISITCISLSLTGRLYQIWRYSLKTGSWHSNLKAWSWFCLQNLFIYTRCIYKLSQIKLFSTYRFINCCFSTMNSCIWRVQLKLFVTQGQRKREVLKNSLDWNSEHTLSLDINILNY